MTIYPGEEADIDLLTHLIIESNQLLEARRD
jgi:hypothetical protein